MHGGGGSQSVEGKHHQMHFIRSATERCASTCSPRPNMRCKMRVGSGPHGTRPDDSGCESYAGPRHLGHHFTAVWGMLLMAVSSGLMGQSGHRLCSVPPERLSIRNEHSLLHIQPCRGVCPLSHSPILRKRRKYHNRVATHLPFAFSSPAQFHFTKGGIAAHQLACLTALY